MNIRTVPTLYYGNMLEHESIAYRLGGSISGIFHDEFFTAIFTKKRNAKLFLDFLRNNSNYTIHSEIGKNEYGKYFVLFDY